MKSYLVKLIFGHGVGFSLVVRHVVDQNELPKIIDMVDKNFDLGVISYTAEEITDDRAIVLSSYFPSIQPKG